ncbi:diaminopimelate epimerase [Devosia pacifica]|nr:diaminopimelate epimerase [Devosia pacifica]
MNGLGNAILVVDIRDQGRISSETARHLAAQPRTAFDQAMVIAAPRTPGTDALVTIYNADGSKAGACGNGTRCVAYYLGRETGKSELLLETVSGLLAVTNADQEMITVDMGKPRFEWDQIPLEEPFADTTGIELQVGPIDKPALHTPSVVNVGNPHAVFWVHNDPDEYALDRFGPLLENHPIFPERANISVAQVLAPDRIKVRVWERGAGLTLACGTAACAVAVTAARKGLAARAATIVLPGGELQISWRESDDHILMTGPWELEHEGTLDAELTEEGAA